MLEKKRYYIIAIAIFSLLITSLHFLVFERLAPYVVLEELYYIPLLFGAIMFGLKGAIITYIIVSVAYLPFFYGGWATGVLGTVDRVLHLLFSGVFSLLAGFFVERLKRQQRELERNRYLANLGHVAATIVHDLKNPLITILGFTKRIQEGKGNINTATEAITESAQNMQKIVNSVLDFSKPIKLELKKEDVRNTIIAASESCRTKAEEKGIKLIVNVPDLPVYSVIDEFNLQRAIVNIINNAIEASDSGKDVKIALAIKKEKLVIRVEDQGSGMDDETLENIFFPFYSKKTGGTGLGMAIAKKIIDGHQGQIIVKSKTGKGTTVEIELLYNPLI